VGAQLAAVVVTKLSSRAGRNRMVVIDKTHKPSSLRDVEHCGRKNGESAKRKALFLAANYANLNIRLGFGSRFRMSKILCLRV
jgi:hypothetical protein